jgi:uncharacterized membrane protein (DUF485 family)
VTKPQNPARSFAQNTGAQGRILPVIPAGEETALSDDGGQSLHDDERPPDRAGGLTRHNRLAIALAAVAAFGYYSFLFAGAIAPLMLAQPAIGHVPWSFVLGAGVIASAIALTGLYVLVANAWDRGGASEA